MQHGTRTGYVYHKCRCDPCREAHNSYYRERRKKNPPQWSDYNLRSKYGITLDEYDTLLSKQGGVCALCSKPPGKRRLAVDHCHDTGEVRGLLCFQCNTSLGKLGDDVEDIIRRLSAYVL